MICDLLRHQSAPEVEIETFRGDPLEYHYFISVFREVVELKIDDPHGRLVRLLKYTEGEARDTIKHCIQQTPEAGYQNAKLLLERHYGDPHRILAAYRKEIRGWPSLKNGDSAGYRRFYNFLIKCESIMSRQQWNSLDTPDILCALISKLPGNARDKWNRNMMMIRRSHGREPELSDFIDFVDDETLLASDPLFSQEALKQYNERQEKGTRKLKSYVSHAAEPVKNERDVSSGNDCPVCEGRYDLDNCRQFNDLTLEE